jgi:hypothetical protein
MTTETIYHLDRKAQIKEILNQLTVSELRTIEDYAQKLRIRLQDENLKYFINEA